MDREALISLHISKTAGTTLNRIIEWQYSPFAVLLIAILKNGTGSDHHWLDMAKKHLSRSFSVVGICERLEESLMLMAETFGGKRRFMRIKESRGVALCGNQS